MISNDKIAKNLLKPWGSRYDRKSNSKSLREKLFNKFTGPSNKIEQ